MRRRILIILAFALAGVCLNLLVAWVCAVRARIVVPFASLAEFPNEWPAAGPWPDRVPETWPSRATSIEVFDGVGIRRTDAFATDSRVGDTPPPRHGFQLWTYEAGLPLRSLRWSPVQQECTYDQTSGPGTAGFTTTTLAGRLDGVKPPGWLYARDENRRLSWRPLWGGFLVDSALYSASLVLIVAGSSRLRGWLRSRRGLCALCGYPVGTSSVCTECGAPVTASPRTAEATTECGP